MKSKKIFFLTAVICFFTLNFSAALGFVSSSDSYRVQYDSLNSGGGSASSDSFFSNTTMGEVGTGESTSDSFTLKAGFQRLDDVSIAISSPSDVVLTPDIGGLTGGTADGSAAWQVTTDSIGGYTLELRASSSPALRSGANSFADYTLASSDPDFSWSIASSDSEFGFSPEGSDIASRYFDDGSDCNTGSSDAADKCWDKFSTTGSVVSETMSGNQPDGENTVVKFKAQVGSGKVQPPGSYSATIIATAYSN